VNVPTIFATGGPMLAGRNPDGSSSDLVTVFEGVGKVQSGQMTEAELLELETHACPTCGSCSGMFTANSMNCLLEAIGLALPGNGTIPAVDPRRVDLARTAARQIFELLRRDLKPRDLVTMDSLHNAFALDMAMGGSTNTVLHALAIAHEAGLDFPLAALNQISAATPCICKVSPSLPDVHIQDVDRAGGISAILKELSRRPGLLRLDAMTVTGGTDFSDYYDAAEGGPAQSTYWTVGNTAYYSDAIGYVPETAWNNSCASSLFAVLNGYSGAGYCAAEGSNAKGHVVGGSGGQSTHYPVPAWQTGISGYSGAYRSQPDIAGFAANGGWRHYLIFCDSNHGNTCSSSTGTWGGAGGTSFVAPYMAGVAGLLVDYTGSRQGVWNPTLYALAKAQFRPRHRDRLLLERPDGQRGRHHRSPGCHVYLQRRDYRQQRRTLRRRFAELLCQHWQAVWIALHHGRRFADQPGQSVHPCRGRSHETDIRRRDRLHPLGRFAPHRGRVRPVSRDPQRSDGLWPARR